ncbi:MAB_1171c family putative transporter [Streptomyces sp. NPDC046215]|uniref:DUF6545 domain-containing protein n=1 Tax=Streptomyces stramineus TaxID=173861 RepID=A0ABP3KED6_9ACTN
MLTWWENAGITALWAVVVLRAPQAVRHRQQRPLWYAIALTALAMSLHLPPVTALLAHVVPGAHWVDLTKHLLSIADGAAVLWFVLGAAGRQRHTPVVLGAAAAVMTALVLLDLTAPEHARNQITPAAVPGVGNTYWWVFFAFHLAADTTCAIVCLRHSRPGTPALLRYGLRLFGTGILLASALWVLKLLYLHTFTPALAELFSPVTGTEAFCMATGAALPVLARIRAHRRDRAAYRGLEVLWQDLTATAPDVVLRPAGRLATAALPLQLLLYRRVIEIRDAMLVLRNYVPADTLDAIHRRVDGQALPPPLAHARVTARWLAAALDARRAGHPPQPQTASLAPPGSAGTDLAEEIRALLLIAAAYRSPAAGERPLTRP